MRQVRDRNAGRVVASELRAVLMFETPFRRPRKIDPAGQQFCIKATLSEEELDVLRSYGEGFSLLELSGAYQCNKTTILRTIRDLNKKLAGTAIPVDVRRAAPPAPHPRASSTSGFKEQLHTSAKHEADAAT